MLPFHSNRKPLKQQQQPKQQPKQHEQQNQAPLKQQIKQLKQQQQKQHRPTTRQLIAVQLIALQLTALQLSLHLTGCGHFRTYTNYEYNKVGEKKETKKLKTPVYKTKIIQKGKDYYLKIQQAQQCKELKLDVLEEKAIIKTEAPLAWYYIGGGALIATPSIAFYYMAGKTTNSAKKRNDSLTGTFLFLVPGLAAIAFGIYQRLTAGSTTETLGETFKTVEEKTTPCGTTPAANKEIKLGTRTGTQPLGTTNEQGEIKLPHRTIQPLIRHSFDKIEKVYLDIIMENENLGEIDVPWPVERPRE